MRMENKKRNLFLLVIGILLVLSGIYLSVFKKEPHFYTPFSIGILIMLFAVYNFISKKNLFDKWQLKQYFIFSAGLIFACIIIDKIGLSLSYWTDNYVLFFDIIIKYIFEWAVPFVYLMFGLIIGMKVFEKKFDYRIAFVLSLIFFVIPLGFFTEWINLFSHSWTVLSMPISNFKIKNFFIIFQIIGYPIMAIVPFVIYKLVEKIK